MTDLFVKIKTQQEQNLPFVVYSKPDSQKIIGLFQKNDHLYFLENYKQKGFVFAPFELSVIPIILANYSDVLVETFVDDVIYISTEKVKPAKSGNDFFESLVVKAVDEIQSGNFQKVVVSRRISEEIHNFEVEYYLKKMKHFYPNAFVYCFSHPKIGTWLGASPEQFVKIDQLNFKTVALAGTKSVEDYQHQNKWGEKEKHEQQLVTDYIESQIQSFTKELSISKPTSVQAGNLMHLKTEILGKLKTQKSISTLIEALHPTSAVCGMPKEEALSFINQNEGYDREYYSGFLGELNIDFATFKSAQTDLFVNLRCMKVVENTAYVYVGCGITSESNSVLEYEETENKAKTMQRIIN